jgi:hypothetical protein
MRRRASLAITSAKRRLTDLANPHRDANDTNLRNPANQRRDLTGSATSEQQYAAPRPDNRK